MIFCYYCDMAFAILEFQALYAVLVVLYRSVLPVDTFGDIVYRMLFAVKFAIFLWFAFFTFYSDI